MRNTKKRDWRKLYPEFFTDEDLIREERRYGLPERSYRLVFAGLWTQADDAGRVRWDGLYLRPNICPNDRDVDEDVFLRIMLALVETGRVRPYIAEGRQYAQIRNWHQLQIQKPLPNNIWYPAPPEEDAQNGEQLELPVSRARDHVRDQAREHARSDQLQDQQQDHSSTRRRHDGARASVRPPDDDDLARGRLPEWVRTGFDRAFKRPMARGEAQVLVRLLGKEAALRAVLHRIEGRTAAGREPPSSVHYVESAVGQWVPPATPGRSARLEAELTVGRTPADLEAEVRRLAEDEENRRREADAERLAFEALPTCPRCNGAGCLGWGADWRCRDGRRAPAEPYEIDMARDLAPDASWPAPTEGRAP